MDNAQLSSDDTAQQPQTSPYTEAPVTLHISSEKRVYYVPRHLLPSGWSKTDGENPIPLYDVEMETGHTLFHYLYTGEYQTLDTVVDSTLDACNGLKRAFLVYAMVQNHNLLDLRELALHQVEGHCARLDIFEILGVIKHDFTKLGPDSLVRTFLHAKAKISFDTNHTLFRSEAFLGCLDNAVLRDFMLRCVMRLYSDRVSHTINTKKEICQKLGECDQTIRRFSVKEADSEQCMIVRQCLTTSHANEHDSRVEERCGEETSEPETMSFEGYSTTSCSSSDKSISLSESLDYPVKCLNEPVDRFDEHIESLELPPACDEEPPACVEELAVERPCPY